jgi:hypothetical protein
LRLVTNPVEAITLCDFVRVLKGENMKKGIITLIAAASIGLLAAGAPAMASGGSGGGGTSTGGGGGGVPAPAPAPVPVPAPAVCGGLTVAIVYNTAGYWQATGTASKVCDPLPIRIEIVDTTPTMPDGCFTGSGTGVLGVHLTHLALRTMRRIVPQRRGDDDELADRRRHRRCLHHLDPVAAPLPLTRTKGPPVDPRSTGALSHPPSGLSSVKDRRHRPFAQRHTSLCLASTGCYIVPDSARP